MNIKKTSLQITRKLTTIENALKRKLNAFYNSNIKDNPEPIETLRQRYESTIKNLIRKTIQDAYLTGTDIVSNEISNVNSEFVPFISVSDVQNISSLTEKTSNQFWKTAGRLHLREQSFIVTPTQDLVLKPEFDITAAMIGFSAFAAYEAFTQAELTKLRDLGLNAQVMFLTQEDAAVDTEICEPLNRTVYNIDDFDIPETPLHNHCRCRLVTIINDQEIDTGLEPTDF